MGGKLKKAVDKYSSLPIAARASLWFTLCNIIQSGIKFLTIPFLTRLMSADQYGVVAVFNSWVSIVIVIATLNLAHGVFNNGMAYYPENRDSFASSMVGLTTISSLVVGIVAGVVFQASFSSFVGLDPLHVLCMFIASFSYAIFSLWAARNRYEYRYRSLIVGTFIYSVVGAVLSIIAVALTPDDASKASVNIVTSTLAGFTVIIIIAVLMFIKGKTFFVSEYWKFALRFNIPLIPHYLAMVLLGQVDRIVIAHFVGDAQAGMYTVAYQLSIALTLITNAVNSAIIPWIYDRLGRKEFKGVARTISIIVAACGILSIILCLFAPEIIGLFAPPQYYEAVYIMPPVCAATLFMFLYYMYANIEFYYMSNKFIAVATCFGAASKIILNLACIPAFGYLSAGYTSLLSYAAMALAHTLFARHIFKHKTGQLAALYNDKVLWTIALLVIACCISSFFIYPYPFARYILIGTILTLCIIKRNVLKEKISFILSK